MRAHSERFLAARCMCHPDQQNLFSREGFRRCVAGLQSPGTGRESGVGGYVPCMSSDPSTLRPSHRDEAHAALLEQVSH
jgi:hypothetical protein